MLTNHKSTEKANKEKAPHNLRGIKVILECLLPLFSIHTLLSIKYKFTN